MNLSNINFASIPLPIYLLFLGVLIVLISLLEQVPGHKWTFKHTQGFTKGQYIGLTIGLLMILGSFATYFLQHNVSLTTPTTCYSQSQHIDPITISTTTTRLPTSYVVDTASLCNDINFKLTQQNSRIQARVIFLDISTDKEKVDGTWKDVLTTEWIILASNIRKGTKYTLEFRTISGNATIEGDVAG